MSSCLKYLICFYFLVYTTNAWPYGCDGKAFSKLNLLLKGTREIEFSTAAQYALDSDPGKIFLQSLRLHDRAELINYLKSENPNISSLRKQFLERLREMDANIARFRGMQVRSGAAQPGKNPHSPLSPEEKMLLELMVSRSLNVKPETVTMLRQEQKIKSARFFEEVADGKIQTEKDFFSGRQASEAERKALFDNKKNSLFTAMKECLANQTAAEAAISKEAMKAAFSQIVSSSTITVAMGVAVTGINRQKETAQDKAVTTAEKWKNIAVTGVANLNAKDLSLNLFMTALSNGLGTFFLNGKGSMIQRLGKSIVIYQLANAANVTLYIFTPGSPDQASWQKYGAFWATFLLAPPVMALPLNMVLSGAQCLYPQARWLKLANIGSRTAFAAGVNIGFYMGAEKFLYEKDKKP